jgi:predicted ferric reductase
MTEFLRRNMSWLIILLLALFPIARWVVISPLNYRFFDLSSAMTSLGQIAGLVGITLFSISLILGARLKFLDKYFNGLDKVYHKHHIIGALSFSLLLFHPLFLVFKYVQFSLKDAALFLLPSENWARNYGIISLFFMIVLMVLTFYIQLKYQKWKSSHKFMVFVFLFAVLHAIYAVSDISRDYILRYYILGLAFLGLAFGFWRAFLHKYFNKNFAYKIKKTTKAGANIIEIEMSPIDKEMQFRAGQFIFVSFINQNISAEAHPFSITSVENEKDLKIAVKALGDYTAEIKNLNIGDKVSIEGPYGNFSYKKTQNRNQIWIAGGIGITPFLSMARSLKNDDYKIDLYYSVNNPEEEVFSNELFNISSIHHNFKLINWHPQKSGYLNSDIVLKLSGGLQNKDIFLCGPPVFTKSLDEQFRKLGIKKENIHWENFNFK